MRPFLLKAELKQTRDYTFEKIVLFYTWKVDMNHILPHTVVIFFHCANNNSFREEDLLVLFNF